MSTLYVTSLADLKGHLAQLRPDRLVSLLGDEPFPPTPLFMADGHHLRLRFHDIVLEADEARAANLVPPGEPDVARLIEVADLWDGAGSLVVHCFAGVSRSTAAGLVILVTKQLSAFSWGEVGRIYVQKSTSAPTSVYVLWEKRYQLQISGTGQSEFSDSLFKAIANALPKA